MNSNIRKCQTSFLLNELITFNFSVHKYYMTTHKIGRTKFKWNIIGVNRTLDMMEHDKTNLNQGVQ